MMIVSHWKAWIIAFTSLGVAFLSGVESFQTISPSSFSSSRFKSINNVPKVITTGNGNDDKSRHLCSELYAKSFKVDPLVQETSTLTRRLSWLSWWSQMILTTVASVTLVFARNVLRQSHPSLAAANSLPNFVLAGSGIVFSFVSIFWTWAARRLARRLLKKPTTRIQTANYLRRTIEVGVTLNVIGMFFTIIGAEQIVGALAIKALTTSRSLSLTMDANTLLQPLDILVVQANTNTLFSHFASLVSLLYLSRQLRKLDPPSVEQ